MPVADTGENAPTARLEAATTGGDCVVKVGGDWRLNRMVPSWEKLLAKHSPARVSVVPEELGKWDTSLLLFLVHGRAWCAQANRAFVIAALPENLQTLLSQVPVVGSSGTKTGTSPKSVRQLAETWGTDVGKRVGENISFIGECTMGFAGVLRNPRRFRWMDCLVEMQHCWSSSLPIVSLVSFLVGVILAFQAAIQLEQYGAAVFVADLVGLSVVREMGPMMAAVIMAGGIGAAFAGDFGYR